MFVKRGILYVSYKKNGKWKRQSTGLKDTKENRRKVLLLDLEDKPRLLFPPFGDLSAEFIASKRDSAIGTKENYELTAKYFLGLGNWQPRLVTEAHINAFRDHLEAKKLSPNTISSHVRNLRIIFNYFKEKGYIEKNIIKRIPPESKPVKIIPDRLMDDFLEYLKGRNIGHYRFIKFLTLTGFRTGEATSLTWDNVQFDNNRIVFQNTKGKRGDEFPLSPTLKTFLEEFKGTGKVFNYTSTDGLKWLKKVFVGKLEGYTFHDIRRTFCTNLLKGNVNPYKVMKLMRHKDFDTTMRHYTYIASQEMSEDLERVLGGRAGMSSVPSYPVNNAINEKSKEIP